MYYVVWHGDVLERRGHMPHALRGTTGRLQLKSSRGMSSWEAQGMGAVQWQASNCLAHAEEVWTLGGDCLTIGVLELVLLSLSESAALC